MKIGIFEIVSLFFYCASLIILIKLYFQTRKQKRISYTRRKPKNIIEPVGNQKIEDVLEGDDVSMNDKLRIMEKEDKKQADDKIMRSVFGWAKNL